MKEIVRFHYVPLEADEIATDIFVEMELPDPDDWINRNERINEISDAISSYIMSMPAWSFDGLALDIAQSFDATARIIIPVTFVI